MDPEPRVEAVDQEGRLPRSLAPAVGDWLFPSTLAWPLSVALSESQGLKTVSFGQGMARHLLVNLGWIVALLGLGIFRFQRRDLTV